MSSSAKRHEAVNILEALESELAYIPGGRDKENRPLIVVDIPAGEPLPTIRTHLDSLIEYFLSIFSEETKSNGLALLVDARTATWRSARMYIRQASQELSERLAAVSEGGGLCIYAVRPDGFWDKQRVDNYCTKSHRDGEPTYVPLSRLSAYVESNQLTYNLGGSKAYDHTAWIQNRVRVDEFTSDAENLIEKMNEQIERLRNSESSSTEDAEANLTSTSKMNMEMASAAQRILHTGRGLTSSMTRESAQDVLDTVQRIHKLIDAIEQKQVEIDKAWLDMERNIDILKEVDNLEAGVADVTNWILGPADSMLNSHYQIGFDVASSEELRREHEKLELECRETYGKYAEILHKIDSLSSEHVTEDLKSQRDFMDFVCRSFATRLERRRNVLITSQRFFRLVSEYFDKTSEVFDKLIMGSRTCDFASAGTKLMKLERSQQKLEGLERELVKEGEKLSDILSMPVKDALCRDVQIDYAEDIINIQDILDATNARKNIFNDSVELQKLTLKQLALIYTYESDAEQAIQWLDELFDVLVGNYLEIGCDVAEIQGQKQEHQSFQETARSTFEYGFQLVNGARVLRMSCKLDLQSNILLMSRLRQSWRQLRSVGQEQLTRLRVCAVFYRNVTDHCSKLRELIDTVASYSPKRSRSVTPETSGDAQAASSTIIRPRSEIRDVLAKREKLLPEVGRMVRLGRLLRTRFKEPVAHQRISDQAATQDEATTSSCSSSNVATDGGCNLSAVQSISSKLLEVTRLAEKLDAKLCEAGARSQALIPANESNEFHAGAGEDVRDVATSPARELEELVIEEATRKVEELSSQLQQQIKESTDLQNLNRSLSAAAAAAASVAASAAMSNSGSTMSDRCSSETTNVEEYVTATEGSSTPPVPRSRSDDSFLSSEYEDALVLTTCRKADDESTENKEILPVAKCETATMVSTNPNNQEVIEYAPDAANVIQRTIQNKDGKVVKEVTETTTLRVSHDTRMGVASYKLVSNTITDHTDHLDYRELQDLNRTILGIDPQQQHQQHQQTIPLLQPMKTHREEHTYTSPTTQVNYMQSIAKAVVNNNNNVAFDNYAVHNGGHGCYDEITTIREEDEDDLLREMRSVSVEERMNMPIHASLAAAAVAAEPIVRVSLQQHCVAVANAAVEELVTTLPTAIAMCEFN